MPEDKPRPVPKPRSDSPPARPTIPGPIGPLTPAYRGPGGVTNVVPGSRWRTGSGPLAAHTAGGPWWRCDACGRDWPCPTLRATPTDASRRATLIPEFSRITRRAIRDLRGRPGGPDPIAVVRRFLWFLPLTDEEARAVALRLR